MKPHAFTSLIVTHNSAPEIPDLLGDLYSHGPEHQIVVIDNASKDETIKDVKERFPRVQLISNLVNAGYAKAVNQGAALCNTEYILLLNPDIRIHSPRLFVELEKCLNQSGRIAAAAPLQFKSEKGRRSLNFTWSYSSPEAWKIYTSFLRHEHPVFTAPVQVPFLNAGCVFIRRAAFEQVGRLNEKYFLYGEEPDLFLKFQRFGYACYLLPSVEITHYRERSMRTTPAAQRMKIRFFSAWNVIDALIHGYGRLWLDKLVSRRPSARKPQMTYKQGTSGRSG